MTQFSYKQLCQNFFIVRVKIIKISSSRWWHFELTTSAIAVAFSHVSTMILPLCSGDIIILTMHLIGSIYDPRAFLTNRQEVLIGLQYLF